MKNIKYILFLFLLPLLSIGQNTTIVWEDNCDDISNWTNSGKNVDDTEARNWAISSNGYESNCFQTEGDSRYQKNSSYIITCSSSIDISSLVRPKLSVYVKMLTQNGYDGGFLEVSGNGGVSWVKINNAQLSLPYQGTLGASNKLGAVEGWQQWILWQEIIVDLSQFEGSNNLKLRFSFGSDGRVQFKGMSLDKMSIYGYTQTKIHNKGGSDQLVFNNSYLYLENPLFRISSNIAETFDRFKIEINKSPYFSDVAYIQEFGKSYNNQIDYNKDEEYNLTCDQLTPVLNFEENTTYYVRASASQDNGLTWGNWGNIITFTYKPSSTAKPHWHQKTNYQFETNSLKGLEADNDILNYKSKLSLIRRVITSSDDGHTFGGVTYLNLDYSFLRYDVTSGLRFQDIDISAGTNIYKSFIVVSCYKKEFSSFPYSNYNKVNVFGEKSSNPSTFYTFEQIENRTKTTKNVLWEITGNWYDGLSYQTPDLKEITQEIIDQNDWSVGNNMSYILEGKAGRRLINTVNLDTSLAAKLYIEYENKIPGVITSSKIELASFTGATKWGRLFWEEEGTEGDFRVTVQQNSSGVWTDIAGLTNLNQNPLGYKFDNITYPEIRLVGTFTSSSEGESPALKSWTVTADDLLGESDLTLLLDANDLTPCKDGSLTYYLSVANNGPDEATNIVIDFNIPSGLNYVSYSSDKGTYQQGKWELSSLQDGEIAVLKVQSIIAQGGNITANANVSTITPPLQTDNDLLNNTASLEISVSNNIAPEIGTISNQQSVFNTPFPTINFTVNDDGDLNDLIITAKSDDEELIPLDNFVFGGSGTLRTLDITPGDNQSGLTNVTLTVDDGICASTTTFVAQVVINQYTNMQSASIVVGQTNFTEKRDDRNLYKTPGASSCKISPLGVLAVGSEYVTSFNAHNGRVMIWNNLPELSNRPANVVVGKSSLSSYESDCTQKFIREADGVAFSTDGTKLLVTDMTNNRVLIWNTIPTYTGQNADLVIGQTNFTSRSSGCSETKLKGPVGVFVAPDGKLFIADSENNRVLIYNSIPTTLNAKADVVIGQDNFSTNISGNSANKMNYPYDITMSTDGKLLVADTYNNRILVFNSVPQQNGASADYVIGQEDFGISSAGLDANKFDVPYAVTVSPTGMLAVGEFTNNRVLIFNTVPNESGASADVVLGQDSFYSKAFYNDGFGASTSDPTDKNLTGVFSLYFDLNDRLFVAGRRMNRVMVFGEMPDKQTDLEIDISCDDDNPCMGNPVTFTIDVINNGDSDATNIVANAALPSGFYYNDHNAEKGVFLPAGGNWSIPSLKNGESVSLTVTGVVDYSVGGTSIEAFASVRSINQKESDYRNNSDKQIVTVSDFYAPRISRIKDQQKSVNTPTDIINFSVVNDNNDPLILEAVSSNQDIVKDANIVLGGSGDNRTIQITPENNKHGDAIITVTARTNVSGGCTTSVTFTATFGNIWIGKTTDWGTVSNWGGEIPRSGIDAYIPALPKGGNFPIVSRDAVANNIYLEKGAKINAINTVNIQVEGNIYNDGDINLEKGTVEMLGTNAQITGSGTIQMHNVDIKNNTLTCENNIGVSGVWNNEGGSPVNFTGGFVTFNGEDSPQTITTAENFYSLGVDNIAGVTFSEDITVKDTIKLTNGDITSSKSISLKDKITILRADGKFNSKPIFAANANLVYASTVQMENEVPTLATQIQDFRLIAEGIEVTLNSDIELNDTLELKHGVLTTGTYKIVQKNAAANNLVGGNSNSFVNGILVRYIDSNTDAYRFPVGKGATSDNYIPVELVNNNLTGTEYLTVSSYTLVENVGDDDDLATSEGGANWYVNLIQAGVWSIIPNVEPTGGSYEVKLYFNSEMGAQLTDNKFGVLKRPSGSTNYGEWNSFNESTTFPDKDLPGRTVAGGYAQRNGLTSFSEFAIASSKWPLPVNLTSFVGNYAQGSIKLDWTTQSEFNNDYFIIEKSTDAVNFYELTRVKGSGTISQTKLYNTIDDNISANVVYYRLKQVDFDGKVSTHGTISVSCPLISRGFEVYPQPAHNLLNIDFYADYNGIITIEVLNYMGSSILKENRDVFEGKQTLETNIDNLNAGMYIFIISDGTNTYKRPIIVN